MRVRRGKATLELSRDAFQELTAPYSRLLLDVGTGSGVFAYDYAKAHPETFVIGLDAAGDAMAESSARALKKPARGGVPNVLYLVAAIEAPPQELVGRADEVTVLYPWGSLLKAAVAVEPAGLTQLASLGKPGAPYLLLLNASVFENLPYAQSLGLPVIDEEYVRNVLHQAYDATGLRIQEWRYFEGDPPIRTSWGRQLVRGAHRRSLEVKATKSDLLNRP